MDIHLIVSVDSELDGVIINDGDTVDVDVVVSVDSEVDGVVINDVMSTRWTLMS